MLTEDAKKSISKKKLDVVEKNIDSLESFIEKICKMREEQYQIKEEAWTQKLVQIKSILEEDNYFLFIGRFSAGKSSFINALLGIDILPTASAPCTAVVTEVRFAENCKGKSGYIVYQNGRKEAEDQDVLKEIIKGKKHIETGAIHHIELTLDINELGDNKDSFKSLVEKIVIVDCPGFDSPYKFPEEILYEYVEKASFTFYLLPANDFGGITEVRRLENIKKKTTTLIPLISKSDLIEDEEDKESIKEEFDKVLSSRFDRTTPIFISQVCYKTLVEKMKTLEEKRLSETLSEEESQEINSLTIKSGICEVFNEIARKSKDSELNEKKLLSVMNDFNEIVKELKKSTINEENFWQRELDKIGYNVENKTYKDLENSNRLITQYIKDQSREVSQELKNNIAIAITDYLNEHKGSPDPHDINKIFSDEFGKVGQKYNPIWEKKFKEYFDEISEDFSIEDPQFKAPNFNFPMPFNYISEGILDGISNAGVASLFMGISGAGLIGSKAAIAGIMVVGKFLAPVALIGGIAMLAYAGINGINPIKDGIAHRKEKRDREVQNKILMIIENDNKLNFEETIHKALSDYKDLIRSTIQSNREKDKSLKLSNYEESKKMKEELETIQNNLNIQVL